MSEHSDILEKAAGIIREKGKLAGNLWKDAEVENCGYVHGPVCAIGALSIASGTHQRTNHNYGNYNGLVDDHIINAVSRESPVHYPADRRFEIYTYSDNPRTTAEDIAQMFERAAKNV